MVGPALERADDGFLTRIGRSLAGESLVGMAVLLAAAVLVDSKPPARPVQAGPSSRRERRRDGGGAPLTGRAILRAWS